MTRTIAEIAAFHDDPEAFRQDCFPKRRERALEKHLATEAEIRRAFTVKPRDEDE